MSFLQAIILAALLGAAELFPVSSLGHASFVPAALGWPLDPRGPGGMRFLTILHLGTAAALLAFYRRDWGNLIMALAGAGDPAARAAHRRLALMLVIGTVPAAILAFLFSQAQGETVGAPGLAALVLIVNGVILFFGDRRKTPAVSGKPVKPIADLTMWDATIIGILQCTGLIPGLSRSGITIVAGLARRLTPDAAAHFSFLLATLMIGGTGLAELPSLLQAIDAGRVNLAMALVAGIVAAIAAYLSAGFLTRYFHAREAKVLRPFALYCVIVGIAAITWFVTRPTG